MNRYKILFHIDYEEEIYADNEKKAIEIIYENYESKYGFLSIDKVEIENKSLERSKK